MDNIVLEKFGSKALRIFRVIRQKAHVEESQLQNLVWFFDYKFLSYFSQRFFDNMLLQKKIRIEVFSKKLTTQSSS